MTHYPMLFTPGKIGTLTVRNRIVMPPIATNYASPSGEVTERLICFLEKRGRGGAGLIIVEGAYVSKDGKGFAGSLAIDEDNFIPKLGEFTRRIRATGAAVALQLIHSGRQTKTEITQLPIVAPSDLACPVVQQTPVPLNQAGIVRIVQDFSLAACRAKEAGFDAIEIQGAHGYLIHQFLSPLSNRRDDDYGGSGENRVRFAREILNKVRETVGEAFPVIFRIDAEEYIEGGIDLDLSCFYCEELSPYVNAVHVSAGSYASRAWIVQSYFNTPGLLAPLAGCIRSRIKKPVIAVGRIHTPQLAEEILERGDADFIAMGRALLADPDLPRKAQIGEARTIMPCLSCYLGCSDRLRANLDISCFVNPLVGQEYMTSPKLEGNPHCLIVGGGPAGFSAAIALSERGARITLIEKRDRLGGQGPV
ncbi:MAG: FAD-dependent oxidoreductase [Syntrophobacteraceae bacterium]|jgi:2,4-dienoyl-CoA reductase-like NADH-dependent reductase (Old Yellow Enzyme family)